jgi:hypothetical protein
MESCVGTRDRFRTLQAKRPEANPKTTAFAVCRKAAGMPGRVETPSSYCQPYSVHTQSIFSPRRGPRSVHVRGSTSPWTSWDPVAFNVEGGSQGHGEKGWGLSRAMEPLCLHFPGDPTVYLLGSSAGPLGAAGMAGRGVGKPSATFGNAQQPVEHRSATY